MAMSSISWKMNLAQFLTFLSLKAFPAWRSWMETFSGTLIIKGITWAFQMNQMHLRKLFPSGLYESILTHTNKLLLLHLNLPISSPVSPFTLTYCMLFVGAERWHAPLFSHNIQFQFCLALDNLSISATTHRSKGHWFKSQIFGITFFFLRSPLSKIQLGFHAQNVFQELPVIFILYTVVFMPMHMLCI